MISINMYFLAYKPQGELINLVTAYNAARAGELAAFTVLKCVIIGQFHNRFKFNHHFRAISYPKEET